MKLKVLRAGGAPESGVEAMVLKVTVTQASSGENDLLTSMTLKRLIDLRHQEPGSLPEDIAPYDYRSQASGALSHRVRLDTCIVARTDTHLALNLRLEPARDSH